MKFSLRGNFPTTMTSAQIKKCIYHPDTNPFCPIFRVGDVLRYTGQNVSALARKVLSVLHLFLPPLSPQNFHTLHPQG